MQHRCVVIDLSAWLWNASYENVRGRFGATRVVEELEAIRPFVDAPSRLVRRRGFVHERDVRCASHLWRIRDESEMPGGNFADASTHDVMPTARAAPAHHATRNLHDASHSQHDCARGLPKR